MSIKKLNAIAGLILMQFSFLISSMSRESKGEIKRAYDRHFAAGCSFHVWMCVL